MNRNSNKLFLLGACLFIAFSTLVVYWQVLGNGFCFDDNLYITSNEHVSTGLTWENFKWAFTSGYASNWHPLTWLSHMLDCQVFKLNPGPHHLVNVFFHLVNTVLLFLFLSRTTKTLWRAAFVAGLFALHPLHVESVAWIAERKDVLSTFLGFLTMLAYAHYAEKPNAKNYILVILFFALGLMAKPMLVTMPFVLLLMDYWPLDRLALRINADSKNESATSRKRIILRLIYEKIPMLVLALASSIVTYLVQKQGDSVKALPFYSRLINAVIAYSEYIIKSFWPVELAAFYPYPSSISIWHLLFSIFFLVGVSFWAIRCWRTKPWFLTGWLWYLGTLVPVIGLVQVGGQAMADRYTYVPLTGLFIIATWAFGTVLMKSNFRKIKIAVLVAVIFAGLTISSWKQIGYWRDNVTLFEHALKVAAPSALVYDSLAIEYALRGQLDKAIKYHRAAIEQNPGYYIPYHNLALVLQKKGDVEGAIVNLNKAIKLNPNGQVMRNVLAGLYFERGQFDEAIEHWTVALKLRPDEPNLHNNLASAFYKKGNIDKAIEHWEEALRLKPDWTEARGNLDKLLLQKKRDETIAQYLEKVRQNPDDVNIHNELAEHFYQKGENEKAIEHWTQVVRIKPDMPEAHNSLATAYYRQDKLKQAIEHWTKASELRPDWAEAYNNLAWVLAAGKDAKLRNPDKAIQLAQRACELTSYKRAGMLDTLGVAYAAAGRFPDAVKAAQKAIELATAVNQQEVVEDMRRRLELYNQNKPYCD